MIPITRTTTLIAAVTAVFALSPMTGHAVKLDFCYKDVTHPSDTVVTEPVHLEKYLGKKKGYVWSDGSEWYVKPKWYDVRLFSEGRGAVGKSYDKWGYVDTLGVEVIKPQYVAAKDFHCGLAAVKTGKDPDSWGYIDRAGNMVIAPTLRVADDFTGGMASVRNGKGEWGIIDKEGKWLSGPQAVEMHLTMPNDSTCHIKTPGGIILSHEKEDVTVATDCSEIKEFHEGLAAAKSIKNGCWGFINEIGEWIVKPDFGGANDLSENIAFVAKEKKNDSSFSHRREYRDIFVELGKEEARGVYELNKNPFASFKEGLAFIICAEASGKAYGEGVGIMDKKGKKIQQGVKIIKKHWEDFWGNQMVTTQIPAIISTAYDFDGGIAYVITPDEKGAIRHPYLYKWNFEDFLANTIGSEEDFISLRGYKLQDDSYLEEYSQVTMDKLERWAEKGEFEKTEDWEKRTSPANREAKLRELRAEEHKAAEGKSAEVAEYNRNQQFLYNRLKKAYDERYRDICRRYSEWMNHRFLDQEMFLLEYDADNERFGLQTTKNGMFSISVPIAEAQKFKHDWFAATAPEGMNMQLNENRGVKFEWIIAGRQPELIGWSLSVGGYPVNGPNGEELYFDEEDLMQR